jgi:ABC-2 type transport system permease protein
LRAIVRKELADYFSSMRFFVLLVLTLIITFLAVFQAFQVIKPGASTEFVFLKLFSSQLQGDFTWVINYPNLLAMFFIPILGLTLGITAVNSERSSGTLSRLMSQPIYRDAIINAKVLAGLFIIIIMTAISFLLISGIGLININLSSYDLGFGLQQIGIGVPLPGLEEIIRLFFFWVVTIIYGAFWMGLAVLFSTVFRNISSSILSYLGIWLIFGVFLMFISNFGIVKNFNQFLMISRISPSFLFIEVISLLLFPYTRGMGIYIDIIGGGDSVNYLMNTPLSLGQSLTVAWPQTIAIIALMIICFAISYLFFMRQEVRST